MSSWSSSVFSTTDSNGSLDDSGVSFDILGAPNPEYDAEDLLLAQLQTPHGQVGTSHVSTDTTTDEGTEMDEDERAASEYLNDGQLYLEKSKRQVQVQLLHGHHLQQTLPHQQIVIASSGGQVDPKCEEQVGTLMALFMII